MRKMSFSHVPHEPGDGGRITTAAALPLLHLPNDAACLKVMIFGHFCCGFVIPSWNNALRGIH
jgi:hypothetical protein